ncbi:MAG: hypothetical protein CEE40_11365 [Chloroflexi bacterium B3_Chlor]|nr:MAG: hypothetical protein CEE40_11365 [Chloroflexi bacterium B3_Chlor]
MPKESTRVPSVKKQIEKGTAERFLAVFNRKFGTAFRVTELAETPDVRCQDPSTGKKLYLEITLLADWEDDIRHLLGGEQDLVVSPVISFEHDALPRLKQRLNKKLLASYGPGTALVIRQVSPLWSATDWRRYLPLIRNEVFKGREKNYGAGIWILWNDTSSSPSQDDILSLSEVTSMGEYDTPQPGISEERIVGKVTWEGNISDDFVQFSGRDDVDPVYRIESPHGCQEAILIVFIKDEPESERKKAIEFYRSGMVYYCFCGRGKFDQRHT